MSGPGGPRSSDKSPRDRPIPLARADFRVAFERLHRRLDAEGLAGAGHAHAGLDPRAPGAARQRAGAAHGDDGAGGIAILEIMLEVEVGAGLEAVEMVPRHDARLHLPWPLWRCGLDRCEIDRRLS